MTGKPKATEVATKATEAATKKTEGGGSDVSTGETANTETSSAPAWTLDGKKFDFRIHECCLLVRRPLLSDTLYRDHTRGLTGGNIRLNNIKNRE